MKIMFEKFFPDEYLGSTYKIPFEKLYEQGYRGVIFDIDNTLVPHGAPADERAKRLFQRLREIGFESCLLSNNQKKRVEMFNQEIQTHYIYNALKPARKNYLHAMEIMGTDQANTLFVGDQLFTGVMFLILGFLQTIFLLICITAGFFLGNKLDKKEDLMEWLDVLQGLRKPPDAH